MGNRSVTKERTTNIRRKPETSYINLKTSFLQQEANRF
jgi:hypothetical protein